jgi:DNA-binding MarR family transcriptional regulator
MVLRATVSKTMARDDDEITPEAARAWRLMFQLLVSTSDARSRSLAARRLTPNDARALWALPLEGGRPSSELAREWACDPSNVTFIIDRLERAGLARRQPLDSDRRLKLVLLTPAGAALREELEHEYHRPPPELGRLSRQELRELARILEKVRGASSRDA